MKHAANGRGRDVTRLDVIPAHLLKAFLVGVENAVRPFMADPEARGLPVREFTAVYGAHPKQRIEIHQPRRSGGFGVLVWFHGGGFLAGDKSFYRGICRRLASFGFLTFNVNYRLAPAHPYPVQLIDAARALDWITTRAPLWRGDPSRLVLAGDSAGAHLAAWHAAARSNPRAHAALGRPRPRGLDHVITLILFYGVYDFHLERLKRRPGAKLLGRTLLGPEEWNWRFFQDWSSVLDLIGPDFPPCVIAAGQRDPAFDQSTDLAGTLEARKLPHLDLFFERDRHPEAGHAFFNFPGKTCTRIAWEVLGVVLGVIPPDCGEFP
jgi:acetyl esterase/lipase